MDTTITRPFIPHDIEEIPERNERRARVTMLVCVVYDIRPHVQWLYLYWTARGRGGREGGNRLTNIFTAKCGDLSLSILYLRFQISC